MIKHNIGKKAIWKSETPDLSNVLGISEHRM